MLVRANAAGLVLTLLSFGQAGCVACHRGPSLESVGEAAASSLGVRMPPGARRIHHELPLPGSTDQLELLLSASSPEEVGRFFGSLEGARSTGPSTWSVGGGVTVRAEPVREVPRNGSGGPVLESLPGDARTLITVERGGSPQPCPPCPEGFEGVTVENCRCP